MRNTGLDEAQAGIKIAGRFPTAGDLLNPGIKPMSLASPALVGEFFTTNTT